MARRAKILASEITQQGNKVIFQGAYRGFHALGGHIEHQREIKLTLSGDGNIDAMATTDWVRGKGNRVLENFIHLHPDAVITEVDENCLQIYFSTGLTCMVSFYEGASYSLEESYYCPKFGIAIRNTCIVVHKKAALPTRLSYVIRKL